MHQVAFFLEYGRWPDPCALHSCDNPPCCNGRHLFEGTVADNNADKWAKGRQGPLRGGSMPGESHPKAVLTDDRVRLIREWHGTFTLSAMASALGVSKQAVHKVISGKTWAHVV